MSEVWKKRFEEKKTENPYEIAKKYCQELYTLTNKKVMAKVEKYNQTIRDMTRNVALDSIMMSSTILSEKDIQNNLGEISGKSKITYELYLTGIKTTEYKYRFAFIEFGVYSYPVKLAIDNDIAKELKIKSIYECKDEEEYKSMIINILNSNKLTEVIQGLIAINLD